MKFKVTGANRDTGARMVLEFEAESKAAAERKAHQSGMSVNRVEDVSDGHVAHAMETGGSGRKVSGMHPFLKLIILVAILAALWYFVWPLVRTRM
ncbi:MAG: hypothetical protein WBD40_05625 [Tepidisphaeraceae bacterium]